MGRIQEAMRKAEETRSRNAAAGAAGRESGPQGGGSGTAMAFALASSTVSEEVDPHVVVLTEPGSPATEEYRTLRENLLGVAPEHPLEAILVTSAVPAEGKSVTALNLACSFAEDVKKRVVVIDADLRKPSLHRLMGLDGQRGLADYLGGGTMLEMVLQRTCLPNLWMLPAGRIPPNPEELLGGKRMDDLLARLRRDYDLILIDAPPVVSTADASVLCPRVDGVLLALRMQRTPREVARHATALLRKARGNVVGTVLTCLEADAAGR